MQNAHRIRHLTFHCGAGNESEALTMRKKLVDGWEQMLPSIERVFDEWAKDSEFIRIPRLQINLKAYDEIDLIRELRAALAETLPKNPLAHRSIPDGGTGLTKSRVPESDKKQGFNVPLVQPTVAAKNEQAEGFANRASGGSKDKQDVAAVSAGTGGFSSMAAGFEASDRIAFSSQILEHYLQTGRIPWYAAALADLGTTLRENVHMQGQEIPRCLVDHSTVDAWVRWLQLLPSEEIGARVSGLISTLPSGAENWGKFLTALVHDEIETDSPTQKLLWIAFVLNAAVKPASRIKDETRDYQSAYALPDRQLEQSRSALLKRNVPARWIEENFEQLRRAFHTPSVDSESDFRKVDVASPAKQKPDERSTSEEFSGRPSVSLEPASKQEDSTIVPHAAESDVAGLPERSVTEQRPQSDFREGRRVAPEASINAATPETAETSEPETLRLEWYRSPESSSEIPPTEQKRLQNERIFHAGCVLLHPYIRRLFDASGIQYDEGQIRPADVPRAAALLYFSATGFLNPLDFELDIVRLLLGLPRDGMLLVSPELLADSDRAKVERMLSALIGHWSRLKNTSIDGLRGAFLQRQAFLSLREDRAYLYFERLGHDVLLDFLPYSISTIKLPWMPKPLYVEW